MKYIQVDFNCNPNNEIVTDVLASELSEIGFESFVNSKNGLQAFIPEKLFDTEKIDENLTHFPLDAQITYSFKELEDKNWNEEWEKNYFQPIVIDDKCLIHTSFHNVEGEYEYRILIDPKMAFGTGHHQTTELILREILAMNFTTKSVLDMGCGTAILAILASMKGADKVTAIDIDEWAYRNALENVELNKMDNIRVLLGGAELLSNEMYDVIFANINRNILLEDIPAYSKVLKKEGLLIMSGFYKEDIPDIRRKCEENGLSLIRFSELDNWATVTCTN